MKKLFIFMFIMLSVACFSQNYVSIIDSDKEWNQLSCIIAPPDYFPKGCMTSYLYIGNDTIINNLQYHIVWESQDASLQNPDIAGYIRENLQSKKVYVLNKQGEEGLLYDFNLGLNDAVVINNTYLYGISDTLICNSKDSVLIGNQYLERFHMMSGAGIEETWVEGIGSQYGLLNTCATYLTGGIRSLLCVHNGSVLLYQTSFNECSITGDMAPKFITDKLDTAYVNENYHFPLELSDCPSDSITFFTMSLPDGIDFDTQELALKGTPIQTGIHTIIIYVKNCGYVTDKLELPFVVDTHSGIKEGKETFSVKMIPNPANSLLSINYSITSNGVLGIYDFNGKLQISRTLKKDEKEITLNITSLPAGMYMVRLVADNKQVAETKLVVIK
jgi:hypothetical protein